MAILNLATPVRSNNFHSVIPIVLAIRKVAGVGCKLSGRVFLHRQDPAGYRRGKLQDLEVSREPLELATNDRFKVVEQPSCTGLHDQSAHHTW